MRCVDVRAPAFLATTVLTLALAIGAVAGMFNVVYTVLLKPLPFDNPDRIVLIQGTAPGSDLNERFGLGTTVLVQRTLSIVTFEPGLAAGCRVPHDQHRIGVGGQLHEAA